MGEFKINNAEKLKNKIYLKNLIPTEKLAQYSGDLIDLDKSHSGKHLNF